MVDFEDFDNIEKMLGSFDLGHGRLANGFLEAMAQGYHEIKKDIHVFKRVDSLIKRIPEIENRLIEQLNNTESINSEDGREIKNEIIINCATAKKYLNDIKELILKR